MYIFCFFFVEKKRSKSPYKDVIELCGDLFTISILIAISLRSLTIGLAYSPCLSRKWGHRLCFGNVECIHVFTIIFVCIADAAFVDRADIKQYIGLPSTHARYMILSSCIKELLRVGLVTPKVRFFIVIFFYVW